MTLLDMLETAVVLCAVLRVPLFAHHPTLVVWKASFFMLKPPRISVSS
jgi:hypothetical protein